MRQTTQAKANVTMKPIQPARARRWLSRDPYVDAQGNDAELTQGANLYWYVKNNAVNAVDPMGLFSILGPEDCTVEQDDECYTACQLAGEEYVECFLTYKWRVIMGGETGLDLHLDVFQNCICAPCGTMLA
jgi:hypothetical protein